MYEDYYGFDGKPFHLNPEPSFFFESQGHARALAYLHYGIDQGEGFIVVTGDIGTGKTTLARILYEELQRSRDIMIAQLSVPQCTGNELLQMVADAFGIAHERRTKASLLRAMFDFLRNNHESGKRALLLVDEVQNLPASALETLRTLSNLHNDDKSLVQIILLGQAEFRHTLNAPTLRQLRQRVTASCHLLPFNEAAETRAYIEHRLRHVGWSGDPAWTEDAFLAIHQFTSGTPRRINTFCDRLLLFAFLEELHRVTGETVAAVIEEIAGDFPGVVADTGTGKESDPDLLDRLEQRVTRLEAALDGVRDALRGAFAPVRPAHSADAPVRSAEQDRDGRPRKRGRG